MRGVRGAAVVTASLLASVCLAAPASASSLAITSFGVSPAGTTGAGGTVVFKASTKHAKSCTLRVSPKISGLPKTFDCSGGSLKHSVRIPKNAADKSRVYTFTLTAKSGSLQARAHVTVKQEPALPKILSFRDDHRSVSPDHATTVRFKAATAHAKKCILSSSRKVSGLPATVDCSKGSFAKQVTIHGTPSASPRKFQFRLTALNASNRSAHRSLTVSQAGATPPGVSMSINPASIDSSGGSFTVQAAVSNAKTCTLTSSPDLGKKSGNCSSGTFAKKVTLPENSGDTSRSYSFTLKAVGPGGTAIATLTASEPPAPALPVVVLSLNATPAAIPGVGTVLTPVTVSATLSGASSCTWTEDNGAPTALEACTTSTSHNFGPFTPNTTADPITHTFELDVTGPGGTAFATLTMTQPPATVLAPTLNSITPSPATLTSDGGTLTVSASVIGASTCSMSSSPDVGSLPDTTGCSGGTATNDFAIPANTTGSDITYTITVNATSVGGTATGTLTMTQPAPVPPAPKVVSMTSNPKTVDYHGGAFTITAHVTHATHCTMTSTPDVGSKGSTDCSGGTLTGRVTFPPNNTKSDVQYSVTVHATGDGGDAEGTLTFFVPPKPAAS